MTQKITPFLWFDNQLEQALAFYASVFPDFETTGVQRYGEGAPVPAGEIITATFTINGQEFGALNGGPMFQFNEAVSFQILCDTQEEIDHYWHKLTEGGEESMCGWVKDPFGLSWQVVPSVLTSLISGPDPEGAQRATQAMLQMKKLDIATLQAAYNGD